MRMNDLLTIGKLAKRAHVNVETIRFYEKKSLLKKPNTKVGAFRVYPDEYISKILFIKKAQDLGFTLNEIKDLLILDQNKRSTCENVAQKARIKVEEVQEKIKSLKKMEKSLKKIITACEDGPEAKACCKVSDCFDRKC